MGKLAFLFPGQGSQYVGMGKDVSGDFPAAREVFEEASDALGFDLQGLCFDGPEEKLNLTSNTQPALLAASKAILTILESETGIKPDFLAGHSLGEYTALVRGGVLSFSDAVAVVRKRGELMQGAVPDGEGAMAAIIGMEDDAVADVCSEASGSGVVEPANFNSPGQVVISGTKAGVDRAAALAKEKGARKAIPLPVSVPSHCSLMDGAGKALGEELAQVGMGALEVPVISNVEALPYPGEGQVIPLLVSQLSSPVRWVDSVLYLKNAGVDRVIEVGPGKVLSGLVKRIDKEMKIYNVEDVPSLKKIVTELC